MHTKLLLNDICCYINEKRGNLITPTRVYAHDAMRARMCVYTRVHIHMKEISRKCLIFPGSSPLIKSWKKSLLEVLDVCNDNDELLGVEYANRNDVGEFSFASTEFCFNWANPHGKAVSLFRFVSTVIYKCDLDGRSRGNSSVIFGVYYYIYILLYVRLVFFFKFRKFFYRREKGFVF